MASEWLERALKKILSERETRRKDHTPLRVACEGALEEIRADRKASSSRKSSTVSSEVTASTPMSTPSVITSDGYADRFFHPFKLACESRTARLVIHALDCLQKLIAYGHLRGAGRDPSDPSRSMVSAIVDTICGCFVGEQTDEGIQLQIIKALLTAVTSPTFEVHEAPLLKVLRTCYDINIKSRNVVNQTTAKATLTQMLNVIFSRMESVEKPKFVQAAVAAASGGDAAGVAPVIADAKEGVDEKEKEKEKEEGAIKDAEEKENSAVAETAPTEAEGATTVVEEEEEKEEKGEGEKKAEEEVEDAHTIARSIVDSIVNEVVGDTQTETMPETAPETATETATATETETETETETPAAADAKPGKYGFCINCGIPADKWCKDTRQPVCSKECKLAYLEKRTASSDTASITSGGASASAAAAVTAATASGLAASASAAAVPLSNDDPSDENAVQDDGTPFDNVLQKDAYLIFRTLCKLSMRPVPDSTVDPRGHGLRYKIFSLELLLNIMQNAGPIFKTSDVFVNAVKQYLCLSLSKNGVSPAPEVFELSLNIFLTLLAEFKFHLKTQLEVFFKDIFLSILESATSSFKHKWMVMTTLSKICSDRQTVADIYVNYDCGMSAENLFERLVNDLSSIARGRHSTELGATPQEQLMMKNQGLSCLVATLSSMVDWMNEIQLRDQEEAAAAAADGDNVTAPDNSHAALAPSLSSVGPSASAAALSTADGTGMSLEQLKAQKGILEQGVEKFNTKPKKGIAFLQENGMIGSSTEDVARFLLSNDRLSRTMVGEYLGEPGETSVAVMYAYVDLQDFGGLELVDALRRFLEGFRLPGESQKIDRLMEKFAQRYCDCNPKQLQTLFASADTAYVLAYSIIMLTTDLHNPQVRKKMSDREFIRNNRGINDSRDLPEEYLENIYQQIKKQGIRMKGEKAMVKPTTSELLNEKQRKELYSREMEYMLESVEDRLRNDGSGNGGADTTFITANRVENVRNMLKVSWSPVLAAFSQSLKSTDDMAVVQLCLEGFQAAIHISAVFLMELERDAFVQSLAKFTNLGVNNTDQHLKPKHIETIKTLISIAHQDGNYLQGSWKEILHCISQLEKQQLIGTSGKGSHLLTQSAEPGHHHGATSSSSAAAAAMLAREGLDDSVSQSVIVAVDRVFTGSVSLHGDAIESFVRWLCLTSQDELQSPGGARMFCLQKIVEIAFYNLGVRVRVEMSRIWAIIGDHFNRAGCSANSDVSMFAIDSLRQLSLKFLEKAELALFSFQKDFLRPFEYIMNHNKSPGIRDMVVRCVSHLVASKARNIRSGWKNIFFVFSVAGSDDSDEAVVNMAFETTSTIVEQHFPLIADSLHNAINCLCDFACNPAFPETAMDAIRLIDECARKVAASAPLFNASSSGGGSGSLSETFPAPSPPQSPRIPSAPVTTLATATATPPSASVDQLVEDQDKMWVRGWFPIVFGLVRIISRSKLDIRTRALTVLFDVIKQNGSTFKVQWWHDLFRVIFRIYDDLKQPDVQQERVEWMNTTLNHCLYSICEVYAEFFDVLAPVLTTEIFERLEWCVQQNNEQLSRSGVHCLQILVMTNGPKFDDALWTQSVEEIEQMFQLTTPNQLLDFDEQSSSTPDVSERKKTFQSIIIRCVSALELIQAVKTIVCGSDTPVAAMTHSVPASAADAPAQGTTTTATTETAAAGEEEEEKKEEEHAVNPNQGVYALLSTQHCFTLLDCLHDSFVFADNFNANHQLRTTLWKAGFMTSLPNLMKQATAARLVFFKLLTMLYHDEARKETWPTVETRLTKLVVDVLNHFASLTSDKQRDVWGSVVNVMLLGILKLNDTRFLLHMRVFFAPMVQSFTHDVKADLRITIRDVLLRHGQLLLQSQ